MALLTVQSVVRTGLNPVFAPAEAGGDNFPNADGLSYFHVKNADTGAHTATFKSYARATQGLGQTDLVVSVPAGEERVVGPFAVTAYNNTNTNQVEVTYDAVTAVTVAAFRFDASS